MTDNSSILELLSQTNSLAGVNWDHGTVKTECQKENILFEAEEAQTREERIKLLRKLRDVFQMFGKPAQDPETKTYSRRIDELLGAFTFKQLLTDVARAQNQKVQKQNTRIILFSDLEVSLVDSANSRRPYANFMNYINT